MKVVRAWEEDGVTIPEPYRRTLKVLFAPDKEGVSELTFSHVLVPPGGQTDHHAHDRPELIYVVSGQGIALCQEGRVPLTPGVALWAPRDEPHQIHNTGSEDLTLVTVFVPGYGAQEIHNRCLQAAAACNALPDAADQ